MRYPAEWSRDEIQAFEVEYNRVIEDDSKMANFELQLLGDSNEQLFS